MPRGRRRAHVTERTFYDPIVNLIREKGGSGLPEISYISVPDIVFTYKDINWFMSVKIGESLGMLNRAFIQYIRHKEESGIDYGILLFLPEEIRRVPPTEEDAYRAMREDKLTCIVDAGLVKEAYSNITFLDIFDRIDTEILPLIVEGKRKHYPLDLVVAMLRTQVEEVMSGLSLDEEDILHIITNRALLADLSNLADDKTGQITIFLAAYILLSQILFLRFFASEHPGFISGKGPVTHKELRGAFSKILDINYRPIYEINVLDSVSPEFLQDTFDLIWGLEIESMRYEIPGRLFHALMPFDIRKMLAAFYTRPHAAEILSKLSIRNSNDTVFDPACGSGTILTAAYKEKLAKFTEEGACCQTQRYPIYFSIRSIVI